MAEERRQRKIKIGRVTSAKMDKSIVVTVERQFRHPRYKKFITKTKKYMAHDQENKCSAGDVVRIVENRPVSSRKRWRLLDVVEAAKEATP